MDHIIKEFIDFRMHIASLGAKMVLWGPIQGTITSEIEMKKELILGKIVLVLFFYFSRRSFKSLTSLLIIQSKYGNRLEFPLGHNKSHLHSY